MPRRLRVFEWWIPEPTLSTFFDRASALDLDRFAVVRIRRLDRRGGCVSVDQLMTASPPPMPLI